MEGILALLIGGHTPLESPGSRQMMLLSTIRLVMRHYPPENSGVRVGDTSDVDDVNNDKDICVISRPDVQRELDVEHVKEIYNSMEADQANGLHVNWGTLHMVYDESTGRMYLIDGQHRAAAMRLVLKKTPCRGSEGVFVLVQRARGVDDLRRRWRQANSSRVAEICDCTHEQEIYNLAMRFFHERFPSYVYKSKCPRRPNLSASSVRTALEELLKQLPLNSEQKNTVARNLPAALSAINLFLQTKANADLDHLLDDVGRLVLCKLRTEPSNQKWYCGLYDVRDIFRFALVHILHGCSIESMNFKQNRRKSLTSAMRREVWHKANLRNSTTGNCYVCNCAISIDTFECAHIIPRVLVGGVTEVRNLQPTCHGCNSEMRTEDLNTFKRRVQDDIVASRAAA